MHDEPNNYTELAEALSRVVDDEKKGPLEWGIEYGSGARKRFEIIHRFNTREKIAEIIEKK